jgi:hypothetical protein
MKNSNVVEDPLTGETPYSSTYQPPSKKYFALTILIVLLVYLVKKFGG